MSDQPKKNRSSYRWAVPIALAGFL